VAGPILPGGGTQSQPAIEFQAPVTDADGDQARLEIEIVPVGTGFSNVPNFQSAFVATGGTAVIDVLGGIVPGPNHWQYRIVDDQGNAGAWASFGGNLDPSDTDFIWLGPGGLLTGSRGHHACLSSAIAGGGAWMVLVVMLLMLVAVRRCKFGVASL